MPWFPLLSVVSYFYYYKFLWYRLSKKLWPLLYSNLLHELGNYFLDRQYIILIYLCILNTNLEQLEDYPVQGQKYRIHPQTGSLPILPWKFKHDILYRLRTTHWTTIFNFINSDTVYLFIATRKREQRSSKEPLNYHINIF